MWPCPITRTPHEINHYNIPSLSEPSMHWSRMKNIFYEKNLFISNNLFLGGGGPEINNFLSPNPTDATYQIWLAM